MKGNVVKLSSKQEPDSPYLVVGYNERAIAIDKAEPVSDDLEVFAETSSHRYATMIMPMLPIDDGGGVGDYYPPAAPRKRSILDTESYEVITKAGFTSMKALKEFEGWLRGCPEVHCNVYYSRLGSLVDFIMGEASCYKLYLGKNGWYTGRRFWGTASVTENNGNWYVMRWVGNALPKKMAYYF